MNQSCVCTWMEMQTKLTLLVEYYRNIRISLQKVFLDYQAFQNTDQSLQMPSHLHFTDYLAPTLSEVPNSNLEIGPGHLLKVYL